MPALAAVAALLQAVTALLTANSYRTTEGLSILTGVAALGLFLALLGSRVMLSAVRGGYELLGEATDLQGAYRTRDKDLIRSLARDLEQKDPWVLLSRPGRRTKALWHRAWTSAPGNAVHRRTGTSCWAWPCSAPCCVWW